MKKYKKRTLLFLPPFPLKKIKKIIFFLGNFPPPPPPKLFKKTPF
jgi:hypothetical protein